jgi:hypothetical protein
VWSRKSIQRDLKLERIGTLQYGRKLQRQPNKTQLQPSKLKGNTERLIAREPKSDLIFTGDGPAQFDPKFHQRAGFLYKPVQNETYERIKDMDKVELVSFCRGKGRWSCAGWESWIKEPIEVFRRWAINQEEAWNARKLGRLKPMLGLPDSTGEITVRLAPDKEYGLAQKKSCGKDQRR